MLAYVHGVFRRANRGCGQTSDLTVRDVTHDIKNQRKFIRYLAFGYQLQ